MRNHTCVVFMYIALHLRPVLDASVDGAGVDPLPGQEAGELSNVHVDVVVGLHHVLSLRYQNI